MQFGEPHRIDGDVRIEFRGTGRARFRLQHAPSYGEQGEPDELFWSDVTQISNRALPAPEDAVGRDHMVGVLVDTVDGNLDVGYRRHGANWLRLLPLDEQDAKAVEACQRYSVSVVPWWKPA